MATTEFTARFLTTTSVGWKTCNTENEMCLFLECEGITEDNDNVIGIDYYELRRLPNGKSEVVRRWDFGKPYLSGYWRKIV